MVSLVYLGTSIKNSNRNPVESKLAYCSESELQKIKISHDEFPMLLDGIKNLDFVKEVSLVSTCNRFEIYAFVTRDTVNAELQQIQEIIQSINKSDFKLGVLMGAEAELQFYRTYCGLNSVLLGEDEISQQIEIAFKQSLYMGYLQNHGAKLLQKATELRCNIDQHALLPKLSYCKVSLQKSLEKFKANITNIAVLGSGSTAKQACLALVELGLDPKYMKLVHRISSSSNQVTDISKTPELSKMKFQRSKYGYHVDKVKDIIFNSDLVIFTIDSKQTVINLPATCKTLFVDFNSSPSADFDLDYDMNRYIDGIQLSQMVKDHSRTMLADNDFRAKLAYAENLISTDELAALV